MREIARESGKVTQLPPCIFRQICYINIMKKQANRSRERAMQDKQWNSRLQGIAAEQGVKASRAVKVLVSQLTPEELVQLEQGSSELEEQQEAQALAAWQAEQDKEVEWAA